MSSRGLAQIEGLVKSAIAQKKTPGAVVLVGRRGRLVFRKAFGERALTPKREAMTVDTTFDLASLTKPVATATAILQLIEQGKLRLQDTCGKFFPDMQDSAARSVSVLQLLTHTSGYAAGLDRTRPWQGRSGALQELLREPLRRPAGQQFVYSDINYIALGLMVEKVSGQDLASYAHQHLFSPLKMQHTSFLHPKEPIAPTQIREERVLRGQVHDHVALKMDGIAGHAGLFSCADDLARFAQMWLQHGQLEGQRVLSPATVARALRPVLVSPEGRTRGLGWDLDTAYSSVRGELFPRGSYGHTGFTGTSLWIDPTSQTFVILLTNRVHPDGQGDVVDLRARLATVVAASITDLEAKNWQQADAAYGAQISATQDSLKAGSEESIPLTYRVYNGIDVLEEEQFRALQGMRLGLICNHSSRHRSGRLTLDVLAQAPGLKLSKIFSPEHGLRAELDEPVADSRDPQTGLPVVSLYGERKRPSQQDLQDLDALIFDVQDTGARFYTYAATMRYAMEECAQAKIPFFVLDRPNPLNGRDLEGPLADPEFTQQDSTSFTCPHILPVRHGMTLGELARMLKAERQIGVDLRVVAMDPWQRSMWLDQVQQEWQNPSPNLRSPQAQWLYPGVCLLEACNVSVGRGSERPFEVIGAPWMDAQRLAVMLNSADLPGLRFVPWRFTPSTSKFAGQECQAVRILVTDRSNLRSLRLGLELIVALRRLHPQEVSLEKVGLLLRHADSLRRLEAGESAAAIEATWQTQLKQFRQRRAPYLLYP
jgi:uncharacterized protein YbbC (DUF1343 family)/CubicO group peptidase (beta-lactamase class C family)